MAKFNQGNFEVCAISLAIDLCKEFGHLDPEFLTKFAVPAIGNFAHECGGFALMDEVDPTVKGSLGGISFAQWTGMRPNKDRRWAFMQFCRQRKLHPYSYAAAIGMIIHELKGPEKKAFRRTLDATVQANTPKPKNILMARVVAFEQAFERAGKKHYPGRYDWAVKVALAITEWIEGGMPTRQGYVPVGGGFSADFDKEFGPPPRGPIIDRARGQVLLPRRSGSPAAPIADEFDPYPPAGSSPAVLAPEPPAADPYAGILPPVRTRRGFWPEQLLSVPEIKMVQKRLRDLGWVQVGTIDGRWDADFTIPTIKMVQAKAGIVEDGHYGPDTRRVLGLGVRFEPPAARATVTADDLKAVGEPTVKAASTIKATSWWTGLGGFVTVVGSALSEYAGDAWAIVRDVRSYVDDVPMWVLGLAVLAVAVFLWRKAQKVENIRVVEEQTGANTSLALPHPATVVEPPWQLPGMVAGGGYQPGAYGGPANPPGLPVRLASSPAIEPVEPQGWDEAAGQGGYVGPAPSPAPRGGSSGSRS